MLGGQRIPYKLDLSCPIALSTKSGGEALGWPVTCATELASAPDAPGEIHDLYLAALYLPEDLFPLTHYTADLLAHIKALAAVDATSALSRCMLALPDIERKHRKCLLPILAALADVSSSTEIKRVKVEDAVLASKLDRREVDAVTAAMGLRMGCRAVEEGNGVTMARRMAEEYEQREIMLQIILLLALSTIHPSPSSVMPTVQEAKKRKRRRDRDTTPPPPRIDPATRPAEALELLFDRVAVWVMVAELNTGAAEAATQGDGKRQGVELAVHRLWKHVIHPHFLHSLPAQCASFHLKVFNKPLQPASSKKPRKPQLTRAKPSSDDIPIAPSRDAAGPSRLQMVAPADRRDSFSRDRDRDRSQGPSRATSRIASRRSSPSASSQHGASLAPAATDMRRSTSHTSLDARMRSRSRSISVDPARQQEYDMPEPSRRNSGNAGSASALTRQPSGKDLFKGRQVGLLRRSASGVMRRTSLEKDKEKEDSQNQSQSQVRKGLFGRQTSGGQTQSQTLGQNQSRERPVSTKEEEPRKAETLIMATPSKPRFFDPHGRYRTGQGQYDGYHAPTPIMEEPRSERPTRIAETPVATRVSHNLFGHGQKRKVAPTAVHEAGGGHDEDGDGDGDPFGELMVPTDDEDDGSAGWGVPETPAR